MIALLRGQSLCAVFSAVANVVLLSVSTNDLSVAFYCFTLTILLHLAAFFALAGVTKTAFYKHYAAAPAPAQVIISYHDSSAALLSVILISTLNRLFPHRRKSVLCLVSLLPRLLTTSTSPL